ncbi:MAG: DUF438 domain-containing protein [Chloroflexi bacterium]|nr:DUF438 domain-containing protein [Chloroflexota bacterium]
MSESIKNASQRKDALKEVIQRLHAGETVEDLKKKFGHVLSGATASEIAEAERALISEGTTVAEIQRLCDLHVAVFQDALDQEPTPESLPGHPVFTFRIENEVIMRLLEAMEETLTRWEDGDAKALDSLIKQAENLTAIEKHYSRKENILFPYLEKKGFEGPSMVMWGVDNEIRAEIKQFQESILDPEPDLMEAAELFEVMSNDIIEMIYKEEKILFPAALDRLTDQEWAEIRDQEAEIGFLDIQVSDEWQPEVNIGAEPDAQPGAELNVSAEALLPLSTGALTREQVNLMLTHLPIDVTFVDEHDRVRYFSQGPERIFDRSPAIIGREVTKCHPPQSVHKVTIILDDFRSGKRDVAEFWIPLGDQFIHIRYFALRDAQGTYKGTIEVSQNVTDIRALKGEKRLLDDSPEYDK